MEEWSVSLAKRRRILQQRALILQGIRKFFIDHDYLEVETPYRLPTLLPESHIDAIPSNGWFLHPSPELCMKRMMAAGYEKIFQICRCWRGRERGSQHLPEFTLLEWYRSGADYWLLMEECEKMIRYVANAIGAGEKIRFRDQEIDLAPPWEVLSVNEAFRLYAPISLPEALVHQRFDEMMVCYIEPKLGRVKPTLIYDYPAERAALARLKSGDQTVAERFELYIGGLELANGFSELIDGEEQKRRFSIENQNRHSLGKKIYPWPDQFLFDLRKMPPSAGIALGVDRLVMVLCDAARIDEVVAFTPEAL